MLCREIEFCQPHTLEAPRTQPKQTANISICTNYTSIPPLSTSSQPISLYLIRHQVNANPDSMQYVIPHIKKNHPFASLISPVTCSSSSNSAKAKTPPVGPGGSFSPFLAPRLFLLLCLILTCAVPRPSRCHTNLASSSTPSRRQSRRYSVSSFPLYVACLDSPVLIRLVRASLLLWTWFGQRYRGALTYLPHIFKEPPHR
ncbi:hypothetical protein V8C42DRAFT_87957 [Trichoderma barbatum]